MDIIRTVMIIMAAGLNIAYIALVIGKTCSGQRKRLEELESKAKYAEAYKRTCQIYKTAYEDLLRQKGAGIPEGTVEAVRYAMIHNHPDNGGDPEKFRLYRSCYEKLTGRKC